MARTTATIGTTQYAVSIDANGHLLTADEPVVRGGANAGPAPYDLVLAGLGACTAITLRMYADRKQWPLTAASVTLLHVREKDSEHIRRTLHFKGELSEEQRARLADIAERTPVTLTLKRGLAINTRVDPPVTAPTTLNGRLDEALEETFPASDPTAVTP